MISRLGRRTILVVGPVLVAVLYLLLPGWWQWSSRTEAIVARTQVLVAPPPENEALVRALRALRGSGQGAPVILTYHDIINNPESYSITPRVFAGQMQLLHDSGYRTLTAAQLLAWLHGGRVPPHSVALTFDDGATGVWEYAAPVLARYGFHGIAFIITGDVGTHQPYYMTWPEIVDLKQSGRWDIESHTSRGHVYIATGPHGQRGPFLTSLRYLAALHRVETPGEYARRVRTDLAASKRLLVAHGIPSPKLFAYPFSAYQGTPQISRILHRIVAADFGGAMLDESGGSPVTSPGDVAAHDLHRIDVTDGEPLTELVDGIRSATPLNPAGVAPLAYRTSWLSADGRPVRLAVANGAVALHPAPGGWQGLLFDPSRTSLWRRYAVRAVLGRRGRRWAGAVTGLRVLAGDSQQLQVAVSQGFYQIRCGLASSEHVLKEGALPYAPHYAVTVGVALRAVTVTIAGRTVARVRLRREGREFPAGGIEITGQRETSAKTLPEISDLRLRSLAASAPG